MHQGEGAVESGEVGEGVRRVASHQQRAGAAGTAVQRLGRGAVAEALPKQAEHVGEAFRVGAHAERSDDVHVLACEAAPAV